MLENQFSMTFNFEFAGINDQYLTLEVVNNNQRFYVLKENPKITLDLALPTVVYFHFSGKNYNIDTVVDDNGNILQDKYIKFVSADVDGFTLPETFLYQKLTINTDDHRSFTTPFIGFNGVIELILDQTDIFSQYLKLCQ
jgi:hypothetical protein